MPRKALLLASLVIFYLFFVACSTRPSEPDTKIAIKNYLSQNIPVTWTGSLLGASSVEIATVEIIKFGAFNKEGKYWAVKARVKGRCLANLLVQKKWNDFDKTADFQIYKNDYGELSVRVLGEF